MLCGPTFHYNRNIYHFVNVTIIILPTFKMATKLSFYFQIACPCRKILNPYFAFSLRLSNGASVGCPCTDRRGTLHKFESAARLVSLKRQVLWFGGQLECHDIHTQFREIRSIYLKFQILRQTHRHVHALTHAHTNK